MANLPPPLPFSSKSSVAFAGASPRNDHKLHRVEKLVLDITNPELRENALHELSKMREIFNELAPLLWHSVGTIAVLIQEIISVYPLLSPPTMTTPQSNRVCNSLALLQCVAAHPETKLLFLKAQLPLYLYAFLNTSSTSKPFEYLRLTSLGVIGALVKNDDTEVIRFLLQTEIVPLCLRTMENGSELSKTVATFIVQKVLLDDIGLEYMCRSDDRFFALAVVLRKMVNSLADGTSPPSARLLKHIIHCYLRVTDNPRACDALGSYLPNLLRDPTFTSCLREDPQAMQWLRQLLYNVSVGGLSILRV
ncbi:unnamed protein product [Cochlearia groenlandica]